MIAIDVVLLPPPEVMEKVVEINKEIVSKGSKDIVLDKEKCLPHITLAMGCIKEEELKVIQKVIEEVSRSFKSMPLKTFPLEKEEMSSRYRAGGMGYGDAKKALLAKVDGYFAEARETRKKLSDDSGYVDDVLHAGATRARELADETMDIVREVTGLGTRFKAR